LPIGSYPHCGAIVFVKKIPMINPTTPEIIIVVVLLVLKNNLTNDLILVYDFSVFLVEIPKSA
jgi:hypothetical protein